MTDLGDKRPKDIYKDLFYLNNNGQGLDDSIKYIYDGNNNKTPISISLKEFMASYSNSKIKLYKDNQIEMSVDSKVHMYMNDSYVYLSYDDGSYNSKINLQKNGIDLSLNNYSYLTANNNNMSLDLNYGYLNKYTIKGQCFNYKDNVLASSDTSVFLDCSISNIHKITLNMSSSNLDIFFSNVPSLSNSYYEMFLLMFHSSSGKTWNISNIRWDSNTPNFGDTSANRLNVFKLFTYDNGTYWNAKLYSTINLS